MTEALNSCKNCEFWLRNPGAGGDPRDDYSKGMCRRYDPEVTIVFGLFKRTVFGPVTPSIWWCGEYERATHTVGNLEAPAP